jgi:hypothetical protein
MYQPHALYQGTAFSRAKKNVLCNRAFSPAAKAGVLRRCKMARLERLAEKLSGLVARGLSPLAIMKLNVFGTTEVVP